MYYCDIGTPAAMDTYFSVQILLHMIRLLVLQFIIVCVMGMIIIGGKIIYCITYGCDHVRTCACMHRHTQSHTHIHTRTHTHTHTIL